MVEFSKDRDGYGKVKFRFLVECCLYFILVLRRGFLLLKIMGMVFFIVDKNRIFMSLKVDF